MLLYKNISLVDRSLISIRSTVSSVWQRITNQPAHQPPLDARQGLGLSDRRLGLLRSPSRLRGLFLGLLGDFGPLLFQNVASQPAHKETSDTRQGLDLLDGALGLCCASQSGFGSISGLLYDLLSL